jgi:hypothetical protein
MVARTRIPGGAGRWISMGVAMTLGLAIAVAFIPQFGTWTAAQGL